MPSHMLPKLAFAGLLAVVAATATYAQRQLTSPAIRNTPASRNSATTVDIISLEDADLLASRTITSFRGKVKALQEISDILSNMNSDTADYAEFHEGFANVYKYYADSRFWAEAGGDAFRKPVDPTATAREKLAKRRKDQAEALQRRIDELDRRIAEEEHRARMEYAAKMQALAQMEQAQATREAAEAAARAAQAARAAALSTQNALYELTR